MPHSSFRSRLPVARLDAEIHYVADSERDAEALGCQTEGRVIVRPAANQPRSLAFPGVQPSEALRRLERLDAPDTSLRRPL